MRKWSSLFYFSFFIFIILFTTAPFHNHKPLNTTSGNKIHLTIIEATGMVAIGPYRNPRMGILNTICIQRMIFLSVDAFIAYCLMND